MKARRYGSEVPKLNSAALSGNHNQLGVVNQKTGKSFGHPGKITTGPARNKPRVHLVSSKGKLPAAVITEAIALKQKNQAKNAAKMPAKNEKHDLTPAPVRTQQLKNPPGVAKRPAPKHQNNPAFAGRFTPQGLRRDGKS